MTDPNIETLEPWQIIERETNIRNKKWLMELIKQEECNMIESSDPSCVELYYKQIKGSMKIK